MFSCDALLGVIVLLAKNTSGPSKKTAAEKEEQAETENVKRAVLPKSTCHGIRV